MKAKKSIYNIIASLLYKIVTCVIGLSIPRLFVLGYGSELNGLQNSVTQIFAYIALIEAGVGESALQSLFKPAANGDRESSNGVLSAVTGYYNKIGFIYFAILISLSLIYPIVVNVSNVSYITVVLYILFAGASTGVNFFFQAKILLVLRSEGDGYIESFVALFVYILSSIIKIICILLGLNIVLIQLGHFLVNLAVTLAYYIIAKKKYPWINFKAKPNKHAIAQKNYVMVHKISGLIFHNVDVVLLTFFCGLEVVSIYTMYKLVINMITTIIASFSDSFNFIFGQVYNSGEKEKYCKIIDTFNVFYSALAFALYTITYIMILPFLRLYTAGMDINYIFEWLPVLYIIIEVLQVGREAMLRTITVSGRFKETIYSSMTELVINVVFSIVGIVVCRSIWGNEAGIYGALIGTAAALLFRTFDINYFANRKVLNRSTWKTNKVILFNVITFIIVAYVVSFIPMYITNYLWFVIYGAIFSVVVVLIFIVVQAVLNKQESVVVMKFLKTKLKKVK